MLCAAKIMACLWNQSDGICKSLTYSDNAKPCSQQHRRTYPNSFIGAEFVDWLLQTFPEISSRSEALRRGRSLQDKGLFKALSAERHLIECASFACVAHLLAAHIENAARTAPII